MAKLSELVKLYNIHASLCITCITLLLNQIQWAIVPNLDGYSYYRQDRSKKGDGEGFCIYIAAGVKTTAVNVSFLKDTDIELVWCVVHHGNASILTGCIYWPPNTCLTDHRKTITRIAYII